LFSCESTRDIRLQLLLGCCQYHCDVSVRHAHERMHAGKNSLSECILTAACVMLTKSCITVRVVVEANAEELLVVRCNSSGKFTRTRLWPRSDCRGMQACTSPSIAPLAAVMAVLQ
jgi:hypothetical protein